MKPRHSLRSILPAATLATIVLTLAQPAAQAANYYWDSDGTTAGLGDTAGTWGTSLFWGSMNAAVSRNVVRGTLATANTTIAVGDTVYFGTVNLALGSTASTIAIAGGGVNANRIVFGAGQGSQGVTLSGGGTITLTNGSASIVANNSGTNTIGAVLAGTTGLIKGGAGTVLLTGTNLFTGGVTVAGGGTLQVGNGTSGSLTSQNLTFNNGGGVFNLRSADSGSTQAMGALTFSTTGIGDGTVQSTYGTSGNAELSFTSLAARGAGATGNFVVSGGANGSTNKIVLTGAATGFLDKGLFFGGSSYAAYDAGGYVRGLIYGTDANTAATDTITASNHVQLTSSPAARAGDTLLSLNLSGGGVDYTMNSGSLTVPAILKSGGGALSTISGGTSLTTASNAELVIRTDTSSDLLTISSDVTGFSGGLTKTGEGTLTLSGGNGYTGTTRINAGILAVSGGSAIVDAGAVVLANAAGATFRLDANETIGNISGGGISGGTVNVQGNTLTFGDSGNQTFGGSFSGTSGGGIIKQGAGTLTLSRPNSFAGTFTLNAGTVDFAYGNDGSSSAISLSSGGTISMANNTTIRYNPAAQLSEGNQGTILGAPNGLTFTNAINISAGTANLRITGNETKIDFSGGVTGGTSGAQTFAIYQGGVAVGSGDRQDILFSGAIADGSGGTLGLNVDFAGASGTGQNAYVNLSGQHTFTGPIVVTNTKGLVSTGNFGGFLVIGGEVYAANHTTVEGTGYLGGGNYTNTISLAAGTVLNYLSSANQTLGGDISGAGKVLKEGSGTLTLSVANSYTGTTTVNAGTLLINGSTSSTSIVSVASGATLGGTGTIGGSVSVAGGATVSPGASIESLATGALTMASGSTFAYEVSDNSSTGADLLGVNGTLTLTNVTLSLDSASLLALAGGSWTVGNKLTLISYGGSAITSGFAGYVDDTNYNFGSNVWTFNYDDTANGTNFVSDLTGLNRITLTAFTVVPEPSAALLGGLGLLALLRRRRN